MRIIETALPGVLRVEPEKKRDVRGCFYESLRSEELSEAAGHRFAVSQINYSVSARGTLRGLHGVSLDPGQAKFVSCVHGELQDVVVDLRLGSPTFGRHVSHVLDAESGQALYVPEGMFHGFLAHVDGTCISYACSTAYRPGSQVDVNPLDPELDLPWCPTGPPLLSPKDAAAPRVAEAARTGLLPTYAECVDHYRSLAVPS